MMLPNLLDHLRRRKIEFGLTTDPQRKTFWVWLGDAISGLKAEAEIESFHDVLVWLDRETKKHCKIERAGDA